MSPNCASTLETRVGAWRWAEGGWLVLLRSGSWWPRHGDARCAVTGKRGCKPSSSPSPRGRPLGASSRPACSATDPRQGLDQGGKVCAGSAAPREAIIWSVDIGSDQLRQYGTPRHMFDGRRPRRFAFAGQIAAFARHSWARGRATEHVQRASWVDGLCPTGVSHHGVEAEGRRPSPRPEARGMSGRPA